MRIIYFRRKVASSASKVLTFQNSYTDTTNQTTYTYSSCSIGTAASDRRVHVGGWSSNNTRTVSSVTIGGVSATINIQSGGVGNGTSFIATANVPTGTTADVVVTWSGAQIRSAIGVWSSTGLTSDAAIDTDSSTADPATVTLTTVSGGFVIAVKHNQGDVATFTWSGTGVTERFELTNIEATNSQFGGADADTTTTSLEITCDPTVNSSQRAMVAASF